jgi:hypothetical protein
MGRVEPDLLQGLDDAFRSAAPQASHYAVDQIQLPGRAGQIIATDGRQLLVQSGFTFPFSEDVLVPALPVFGCQEWSAGGEGTIGKSATHICVRVGLWTFHLPVDQEGRFPKVEQVIPPWSGIATRCRFDPADAAFATTALPQLLGGRDANSPITVDLNGQAVLRARTAGQSRATELVLTRSKVAGPPRRVALSRRFLSRALNLGFAEMGIPQGEAPLMFRDERRQFVVMPLNQESALAPTPDALRISTSLTKGESLS